MNEVRVRREALHHEKETNNGIEIFKNGLDWVVRELTGGTGITITDGGANGALTIAASSGITKATTLLSADFAIDAIAVVTVTTAHGLSSTPNIQDVQATLSESAAGNVDDFALGFIKVESVDATNVVCKVSVTAASGTATAKAKLNIMILLGV